MLRVADPKKVLAAALIGLLVVAIAACSSEAATGSEATVQDDVAPTPTLESIKVTAVPTPTAVTKPADTPVPDRNPDEQAVRDIWSSQVAVIASEQYGRLQETCHSEYAELENRTEAEIEAQFKEFVGNFWNVEVSELRFSDPEIQIIGGIQAIVGVGIENSQGNVEPFGIFLTKHQDGNWYDDCAIGGWKSLRLKPSAASN